MLESSGSKFFFRFIDLVFPFSISFSLNVVYVHDGSVRFECWKPLEDEILDVIIYIFPFLCFLSHRHLESVTESGEMMRCLLLISLLIHSALAQDVGPEEPPPLGQKGGPEEPPQGKKWLTLNGKNKLCFIFVFSFIWGRRFWHFDINIL